MNEYGVVTHEGGLYEERVHHVQLAYAPYAALLAAFGVTSLLGVIRPRVTDRGLLGYARRQFLHHEQLLVHAQSFLPPM